eukprot:TRINITY_DN78975_c0_g1_i1.p1 TRINITY_DN78975_c0_g1~~TRINITY_DN78975_c0_g1_i1.p1  ORF type:complete len:483 (+),score=69.24 TRINITY_DN78975_c0_g1_i1:52-1449(+)
MDVATDMEEGPSNARMVDRLQRSGTLLSPACLHAFRAVDRRHFWVSSRSSTADVYDDAPLRRGKLHQSAPHIYARALEALMPLSPGMSFLNIGSGTGYFSCLVAEIIGESGVNDGLELWEENVKHAEECARRLGKHHIEFNIGNVYQLDVNLGMRYDRIYVGACACARARYLYGLLEVGGVLVGPFQSGSSQQLRRVVRESEAQFKIEVLNSVHFASLVEPPRSEEDAESGVICCDAPPVERRKAEVSGLPGVPFKFALRQKPWTLDRNWAYPQSFRCIVAVLLRSSQVRSGDLLPELWISHILPWCPRWWFDLPPTQKTSKPLNALSMLTAAGLALQKVLLCSGSCEVPGIQDDAEGAASGDEMQYMVNEQVPLVRRRRRHSRSVFRMAYRSMRRCWRCLLSCCRMPGQSGEPPDSRVTPSELGVEGGPAEFQGRCAGLRRSLSALVATGSSLRGSLLQWVGPS